MAASVTVVLAFGTRGDVAPLASLTLQLANDDSAMQVRFVTHECHLKAPWLRPLREHARIELVEGVRTPPIVNEGQDAALWSAAQQVIVLTVCASASRLIFNLFALEGLLMADILGLPAVAAHPYPLPSRSSPAKRTAMAAFEALQDRTPAGGLTAEEVEHWIWPALTPPWQDFRRRAIAGLHCKAVDAAGPLHHILRRPPRLLYGVSERLFPRPGCWPQRVQVCGIWQPSVPDCAPTPAELAATLPPPVTAFLECGGLDDKPLFVGFGAAADVGAGSLLSRHGTGGALLAAGLLRALSNVSCRAVVSVPDLQHPLAQALLSQQPTPPVVLVWPADRGDLDHRVLFKRCQGVLHHGGSGTVATAAAVGLPQVVYPRFFDQPMWAERLAWLGLAPAPLRLTLSDASAATAAGGDCAPAAVESLVAELTSALDQALAAPSRLRAACFGAALRKEAGGLQDTSLLLRALWQDAGVDDACPHGSAEQAPTQQPCLAPPTGEDVLMPNGLELRSIGHDETAFLYYEIFEAEVYRPALQDDEVQSSDLSPGQLPCLVLDVGANIGLFSVWLARQLRTPASTADSPRSRKRRLPASNQPSDLVQIVAVEPAPPAVAALRINLARHAPGVRVVPVALASEACSSRPLVYFPGLPGNSTFAPKEKAEQRDRMLRAARHRPKRQRHLAALFDRARTIPVETRPLSDLLDELGGQGGMPRVALLKVDVEGLELDVLRGIRPDHWPLIERIVIEVHEVGDRRPCVQRLLEHKEAGNFDRVWWTRPSQAEVQPPAGSSPQSSEGDKDAAEDTWLVFATRRTRGPLLVAAG